MARTTKSQRREQNRAEAERQRKEAAHRKAIRNTTIGVVAAGSPLNVLYSPDGEVIHVQLGAISRSQILQEFSPYLQG